MSDKTGTDTQAARTAVRFVLEQCFSSVDRKDWKMLLACFSEDAKAEYNSGAKMAMTGRQAIVDRIERAARPLTSTHTLSNTHIVVVGDTAKTET